jgi:hypothetical protein
MDLRLRAYMLWRKAQYALVSLIEAAVPEARRGCSGRYPTRTMMDRLRLFRTRLRYRVQHCYAVPSGKVERRGRWWHLPCLIFGHLYHTTERDYGRNNAPRVQEHECTVCDRFVVDK